MKVKSSYHPKKFGVIGAGPVGAIVAAFLTRGGYEVTLCDVVPGLLAPALDPGIIIEGADTLQAKVARTTTRIDDLFEDPPDVIMVTVKATALPLIASALEGFVAEGRYVVSWQNGIDTELVLAQNLGVQSGDAGRGQLRLCAHRPGPCPDRLPPSSPFSPGTRPPVQGGCHGDLPGLHRVRTGHRAYRSD